MRGEGENELKISHTKENFISYCSPSPNAPACSRQVSKERG